MRKANALVVVNPVRIGLVGAGLAAREFHLPVLSRLENIEVKAVCDTNEPLARRFAADFSVPKVFFSLDDMLSEEKFDLIDVCVPPQKHLDIMKRSLAAGMSCMVENPFTLTTAGADEVIELARTKKLHIYPVYNHSFSPGIRKAKELVLRGAIGDVVGVNISYSEPYPIRFAAKDHWCRGLAGDYFGDAGPHLALLLVELLGKFTTAKALLTKTSNHPDIVTDGLTIIARFENDAIGSINYSANTPSNHMSVDIFGTSGAISVDGMFDTVTRYGPKANLDNPFLLGSNKAMEIFSQSIGLLKATSSYKINRYVKKIRQFPHNYLFPEIMRSFQRYDCSEIRSENRHPSIASSLRQGRQT